jgi:hypothetical protein
MKKEEMTKIDIFDEDFWPLLLLYLRKKFACLYIVELQRPKATRKVYF